MSENSDLLSSLRAYMRSFIDLCFESASPLKPGHFDNGALLSALKLPLTEEASRMQAAQIPLVDIDRAALIFFFVQ